MSGWQSGDDDSIDRNSSMSSRRHERHAFQPSPNNSWDGFPSFPTELRNPRSKSWPWPTNSLIRPRLALKPTPFDSPENFTAIWFRIDWARTYRFGVMGLWNLTQHSHTARDSPPPRPPPHLCPPAGNAKLHISLSLHVHLRRTALGEV